MIKLKNVIIEKDNSKERYDALDDATFGLSHWSEKIEKQLMVVVNEWRKTKKIKLNSVKAAENIMKNISYILNEIKKAL